jgi:hypothetical protein
MGEMSEIAQLVCQMDQLRRSESALRAQDTMKQNDSEMRKIDNSRSEIISQLAKTPRGFLHYTFSECSLGGKIEFFDPTEFMQMQGIAEIFKKYGFLAEAHQPISDEVALNLVNAAMQDELVWKYVKEICSTRLVDGKEMPRPLQRFAGHALTSLPPRRSSGRSKFKNKYRNQVIVMASKFLISVYELPVTRAVGSQNDSVTSLLAEVMAHYGLHMTEDAIRKVLDKPESRAELKGNKGY